VAAAFCLLLGLTACDSGSDDGESDTAQASFDIEITGGGTDYAYSGSSFWNTGTDESGQEATAISLSSENPNFGSAILLREGSAPGTGTYDVANVDDRSTVPVNFGLVLSAGDAMASTSLTVFSNGGSIQITESSDSRLRGTLNVNATLIEGSPSGQTTSAVTVTGTFDAQRTSSLPFFQ
jgi:hypothetical protein